jgi:hypothetical protein
MICKNSREDNGIRWREYYCPSCAGLKYTKEQTVSENVCKAKIRDIVTYERKIASYKKEPCGDIPLLRSPY